jgi:hypothetical protein
VYNGGIAECYVSSGGELAPKVHAIVAAGEILAPYWCDVVAVGGVLEPGGGTAVGAVESLLTSSCFRKGAESRRRHRVESMQGAIIAYLAERARWDTGLVPCCPSQLGVG